MRVVRTSYALLLGFALAGAHAGCTSKVSYVVRDGIAEPANKAAADAHAGAISGKNSSGSGGSIDSDSSGLIGNQTRDETRPLVGEKFRVKDSTLLRGTLSCVGDDVKTLLTVTADAIKPNPRGGGNAPNTPGKLPVLTFGSVSAGADIIEAQKSALFDPSTEGRDSASAAEATVPYLTAATLVAEIVAHNADVSSPESKAFCKTPEAATALIKRCVPTASDASLNVKVDGMSIPEKMAAMCSSGADAVEQDLNSRIALASFLGSWAFLKSER